VPFAAIQDRVGAISRDVARVISFGVGRSNAERAEHALFDDADAWRESDMTAYRQKAEAQLGTVGAGNHYVDLFCDEAGCSSGSACISAVVVSDTPAPPAI
jgi:tRNA-splicing ligase RtcB